MGVDVGADWVDVVVVGLYGDLGVVFWFVGAGFDLDDVVGDFGYFELE